MPLFLQLFSLDHHRSWVPEMLTESGCPSVALLIDHGCVAKAHSMLPWGSQYRNQVSRESHAWVLAALDRDP